MNSVGNYGQLTILFFLSDLGTGDETQDLVHARQVVYH